MTRRDKTKPRLLYLRKLAPKDAGIGTLVHTKSVMDTNPDEPYDLKRYRQDHPELFTEVGSFFTLMESTGDTLTVEKSNK